MKVKKMKRKKRKKRKKKRGECVQKVRFPTTKKISSLPWH